MPAKLTHEQFLEIVKDHNIPYSPVSEYNGWRKKNSWLCYKNSNHIFDATPQSIFDGTGCPYCSHNKVFVGETDLWTTHPDIASMLVNPDEGYMYSAGSGHKTDWICKNCFSVVKNKSICFVAQRGLCCSNCSDGVSYPEKFVSNLLSQLNINYIHDQPTEWSNVKRYDFIVYESNMIIEAHGMQHYYRGFDSVNPSHNVEYEIKNDLYKKELALKNGVKYYIELDCKYSNCEYIKNSIINSDLNNLFNLSNIDWNKCDLYASNSIIITVKDMWNNGIKSSEKISDELNMDYSTIIDYLKKASKLGLCDYKPHCYREGKKVLCVETGKIYRSIGSVKEDGYCGTHVSQCCHNACETAYGLHWQFI